MIIKIATCLLALSVFTACETTQSTAGSGRQTLEQRMLAQSTDADNPNAVDEAMPPTLDGLAAVGEGPAEPHRNPALLPTPLLRVNAAAGL